MSDTQDDAEAPLTFQTFEEWAAHLRAVDPEYGHTVDWDEHPEGYDDPCWCGLCRSYMGEYE